MTIQSEIISETELSFARFDFHVIESVQIMQSLQKSGKFYNEEPYWLFQISQLIFTYAIFN